MTYTGVIYAGDVTYAGCHSITLFLIIIHYYYIVFDFSVIPLNHVSQFNYKFEWTIVNKNFTLTKLFEVAWKLTDVRQPWTSPHDLYFEYLIGHI